MARSFLTSIDLGGNELRNVRIHLLGTDPGSPTEGQVWYNTATHLFKWYDGTTVHSTDDVSKLNGQLASYYLSRANHTGTQLAATISDFDTQVRTSRLDQMAVPTADVSLNSHKITNLATPTSGTDATNKNYVDNLMQGISWKNAVRAGTTANGTLSTAYANGQVIDGVTLATGDRILIKNQTTGSENGIYTVNASGAPTRATDADTGAEMLQAALYIEEGTTLADTQWVCSTNAPITLGTTSLTFAQIGGGTTPTAGNGLTLTSNTYDVGAGTGISVAADSVAIDTTVVVQKFAASVGDGSSTSIDVTHNLGTKDIIVQVYDNTTPFAQLECDVEHKTTNIVTLKFAVAPTSNQYRVVVHA